jgi:uncharacterized protein (DUF362 family)
MKRFAFVAVLGCVGVLGCSKRAAPVQARPGPAKSAPASSVASAEHADTVSHASEVPDAGPPVTAVGSVDGAKLRERHIVRLKSDRSPVTVLAGENARELGQRICEAVVPSRPVSTPILIKPNICGFDGFKKPEKSNGDDGVTGRVTDPEFVRGIVRCLRERGHRKVTIAEGCGNSHEHWRKAIRVSGFEAMAREEDVPLVAMDDDGVFDKMAGEPGKPLAIRGIERTRVPTLLMPKILAETLEHGLFISAPKLKAHRFAVVSLGIKGMQGTVMRSEASPAYNQKWRMHEELKPYLSARRHKQPENRAEYVSALETFAERMLDVLEISLPDVILVDGAPAMSGDGFQKLRRVPGNIAIGGSNPVLVDRVGSQYLGLWDNRELGRELGGHRASPLIEFAARRYGVDLKAPAMQGNGVDLLAKRAPVFFKAIAPFTIDGDQVSGAAVVESVPPQAASAPSAPLEPTLAKPVARAVHTATAPRIDAEVDDVWSNAPRLSFSSDYAGNQTNIETRARFLWDEHAFYALFELASTDLNVDTSASVRVERPKLYQEDCVEMFFTPDPARPKHYYEVELGPLGHFMDTEVDRQASLERPEWSGGLTIATKHDRAKRIALIEARFTAPEITRALRPFAKLPFALYRMEGRSSRKYLAWSPPRTAKPNFHVPEAFGVLVLEP